MERRYPSSSSSKKIEPCFKKGDVFEKQLYMVIEELARELRLEARTANNWRQPTLSRTLVQKDSPRPNVGEGFRKSCMKQAADDQGAKSHMARDVKKVKKEKCPPGHKPKNHECKGRSCGGPQTSHKDDGLKMSAIWFLRQASPIAHSVRSSWFQASSNVRGQGA